MIEEKLDEILSRVKSMEEQQKEVLNMKEVSKYTGLSKGYVYKLTSTGKIPCYKPHGKLIYFKRQELDEWMLCKKKLTDDELDATANSYLLLDKIG